MSSPALLYVLLAVVAFVSGDQCPRDGSCPDLSTHQMDLSPLQGTWDTLYYTQSTGSVVANIPHFFNISLCGSMHESQCSSSANSSVCYSSELSTFYNLGNTSSCQYSYDNKSVKFTYGFSSEDRVKQLFGTGNVSITLICGRTLGVPEVVLGDPNTDEVVILWETSAACKTSTSLRYTPEVKCYHIHTYNENGLRANFIDLTSLVKPQGYQVLNSEDSSFKFLLSVCKPLSFASDDQHPAGCNGSMACLVGAGDGFGASVPLVVGNWSSGLSSRLHMHEGFPTVEYSVNLTSKVACEGVRNIRVHFLCPAENQVLGPHVTFMDSQVCLTIVTWYTSFACGRAAIQTQGCSLTTQGGQTFNFTGLGLSTQDANSSSQLDATGHPYTYSLQICRGNSLFDGCSPSPATNTRVVQVDHSGVCRSLGSGRGNLRYADGTLSLTYSHGDTCHSNFARTSFITFLCPENLDGEKSNVSTVRFLGEEGCFYQFEWVTDLACGSKTSGISDCQFQLPHGGAYNFAPLVGTEDKNWVSVVSGVRDVACFMINPCGELKVTKEAHATGAEYCNKRHAPSACSGVSVCRIASDGSATQIGKFNLGNSSSIKSVDSNVVTVFGHVGGTSSVGNNTAVIHYVCKTGDLFSAPVYVGVTNENFYEFHWATFAACPSGVQSGSKCTVSYQGFLFDLSSIPVLVFNDTDYTYEIAVCSSLQSNETHCRDKDSKGASVCQVQRSSGHHYKLGQANSSLLYEDGTLKLVYTNGQECHHSPQPRNTTILFICDSNAHVPSVSSVTEDECEYVIEVRTKLACPPANRASECVFLNGTNSYDFSDLSRSLYRGNWEARSPDGAVYYINVCQPLNRMPGCSALAGACKKVSHGGHVTYTDIGMAYDAQFTMVHRDKEDRISLTYQYHSQDQASHCPSIHTTIEFICNKTNFNSEVGPYYASGGDEQNPCQYTFLWETPGACPIKPIKSSTCQLTLPSGFTFDLSPLHSPSTKKDDKTGKSNDDDFYTVSSPSVSFDLAICGSLSSPCNGHTGVPVCQMDSVHKPHACGLNSTQELVYFDGSLYLKYSDGDLCRHNNRNRSVLINFECDRTANVSTTVPRYLQEADCGYSFEWPTPLACEPQELECVAAGGKYDLTPLLGNKHWEVDTKEMGGAFVYVIGGCRSLDFEKLPHCPQVPGMGACRYPTSGDGSNLGYVVGDLVEQSEGALLLEYHNGDVCKDGTRSMVHIHFTCGTGAGSGVPSLGPSSDSCHTHINWVTQYACSRSARSMNWTITDPVTNNVFNFTNLPPSLSRANAAQDGSLYNYTVSLNGGTISCGSSSSSSSGPAGACQVKLSGGCNSSAPNCVHTLGVLGTNTSSLSMTDGDVRAEYKNGDKCHHTSVERKAVIIFECDSRDAPFLEVMPENMCEYTFVVHTKWACPRHTSIEVECRVDGFHDLVAFQRLSSRYVQVGKGRKKLYISVCDALGTAVSGCDSGAASCLQDESGHYVNLGKPSSRYPPTAMEQNRGVVLTYVEGDMCNSGSGTRWNTSLLLICNRNVHVGVPEFLSNSSCQYTLRWESASACSTNLPSSVSSISACSLIDPYANDQVLDFKPFLKNLDLSVSDNHGGKYMIQLCGTNTPLLQPAGCESNNGICHHSRSNGGVGEKGTVVYANHTFSLVSHSPRVVDVIFHSGITCESDSSRKLSASVQLVCSGQSETPIPVLVSDSDCELRFVWRNQSFCAGESASGGCSAADKSGYVYSLDGLLAQNWTGLVSPTTSHSPNAPSMGGTFSLGICRNLNPFSSSGLHCSTPSAVCWHTTDNRYINLGRSKFPPEVVEGHNSSSIHIAYSSGDICNGTRQYHTDLYIHCANETSAPTLFYDGTSITHNCSYIISMDSPVACKSQISSTNCAIKTTAGVYNFTDISGTPKMLKEGSKQYRLCLCGNSSSCSSKGISDVSGNGGEVSLGAFRSLSVSSSTGGPKLSYYGGSVCPGHGTTKYQSWLFMECNRSAVGDGHFTMLQQSASSDCMKVFAWYTNRACISQQVSCSTSITTSSGSSVFYDFTPLHSHATPWKIVLESETYYINICGEIINQFADDIGSCGGDAAVCVKPSDASAFSLATASTQQLYYDNKNIVMKFTAPESKVCPGRPSRTSITMTCGIGGLSLKEKSAECHYRFTWSTPYACEEKPQTFKTCQDIIKGSDDFAFYPHKIAKSEGYEIHGAVGRLTVNICGPTSSCSDEDAAVCLGRTTTIGYSSNQTIMVDGYEMLIRMDGPSNRHAIISVVCLLKSAQRKAATNPLVFDNVAINGGHKYYYFTLFTKEGQGCDFAAPTGAPSSSSSSATTSNPLPTKAATSSKATGVSIVVMLLIAAVVVLVLLVGVLYKKERRERLNKAFRHCTVGKSAEPVQYHKISARDEEQSLMANHSDSDEEEEELVTRVRTGREENREAETVMNNEDSDDELINL